MILLESYEDRFKLKIDFFYWGMMGLTFAHVITAWSWCVEPVWEFFLTENYNVSCHSFFKNCSAFSVKNSFFLKFIAFLYLGIGVLNLFLLLIKNKKFLVYFFVFLSCVKFFFIYSRYNLFNSFHELHLILSFIFLMSRGVQFPYRLVLILQYFFSGLAKLNPEWMTGETLMQLYGLSFTSKITVFGLSYITLLELVLIWGLVFNSKFIRRITLLQLVIYHAVFYSQIGMFPNLIMLGLLFPLFVNDFFDSKKYFLKELLESHLIKIASSTAFAGVLLFFYFLPYKDTNNRFLDVNNISDNSLCRNKLIQVNKDLSIKLKKSIDDINSCDFFRYEAFLKRLCAQNDHEKFIFSFEKKTSPYKEYKIVRKYNDLCKEI